MLSPSVVAAGAVDDDRLPLTYSGSLCSSSKYVSVGCATAGIFGAADDMRFSTFSCARSRRRGRHW